MAEARASWYSQFPEYGWIDREDRPGSNALGVPDAQQGIALPTRKTLGQWFDVKAPNGNTYRLQQTDVGPSPRTGRGIDISAAAGHAMGYSPNTFPTDATFSFAPADGSDYKPQDRRPMPNSLSALAAPPAAGFGDRLGAGLQGFAQSGGLLSALGNLIGGISSGQRTDQDFINQQLKQRELAQQAGLRNEALNENRRQFDLNYNKPQVVFKKAEDPETGDQIDMPFIVTPGSPGKPPNVMQLDPNTFKPLPPGGPALPPQGPTAQMAPNTEFSAQARAPVAGLTPEETGQIPAGAAFVQGGAQPTINGVPADIRGKARQEYLKTMGQGRAKADLQKTLSAEGDKTQNDVVRENLDKAITKVNESPFLTTGLVGQISSGIGGTPAHDLSAMIEPIEANIAFDRLNKIRQENARGAGIGNVTDKDMALLKSVLGSLKQSQSSNELLFNLERLRQTYHKITNPLAPPLPPLARMQRPQQGVPVAPATRTGGAAVPSGATPSPASGGLSRDAIQQELIRRGVLDANSL